MIPLVLDIECTIKNKGNPYTKENKLCYIGEYDGSTGGSTSSCTIYTPADISSSLCPRSYRDRLLIGFNLKFDLTWLRRHGIDYSTCRVWDCQLAHFLLTGQSEAYPSLNSVAEHYNLGTKLDVVATEYWGKGIDTCDIPERVMREYLSQDLFLTWQVYQKQVEDFSRNQQLFKLFQLQCEDLLTLLEMEWNGQVVDVAACKQKEQEGEEQLQKIDSELQQFIGDIPCNWNSNDHLSAILYGGTIIHETKVPVGVFKTGPKAGQPRYKGLKYEFKLPGMVEPIKGSELQKEGYFSTDEGTLRSLRASREAKRFIDLLLTRSKLEKLVGTYYRGIQEKLSEVNPIDGNLHGQFNQCVARTGRLSSSKPNLQNFPEELKRLMVSRYE